MHKRVMTRADKEACIHCYRALGAKKGIGAIPENIIEFGNFDRIHEADNFRNAATNAEIGSITRDLLMSM